MRYNYISYLNGGQIMKKTTAVLIALLMLFSFASCSGKETTEPTASDINPSENISEDKNENPGSANKNPQDESSFVQGEATTVTADATTHVAVENIPAESDPSKWTDEEIVAFYKAAAIKSKATVKSVEQKKLEEMVVNGGDGFLGALVEMATPFLVNALEDSQVEFDGITGGYEDLELSDAKSVKAYKSGEYTVIEMTMKEQTDGIYADRYKGTVGHAISVVGDISSVTEALPMFKIDFENSDIRLHYANPTLKVKINKDGIIEKGTWSYDVIINVRNLRVDAVRLPLGATVETAHGSVKYIITVGGGF